MIINRLSLLKAAPIKDMLQAKHQFNGVSYGLSEAGYDIRIKQDVVFKFGMPKFVLASSIEEFDMPNWMVATVRDKSTWARRGISVFNTVIEPGWKGFLTLELVYHGDSELVIKAGSGIAQVLFEEISTPCGYAGKYQNQPDQPVGPKESL